MDKPSTSAPVQTKFSRYEKVVIGFLGFLQFTVILDFMIISPLGAIVMPSLHISPNQFGHAVSSYAFSAGVSGFLAAGFADRFDRKRLLLFCYFGFMLGTFAVRALATTYPLLLLARIVTGLFGGVIGCRRIWPSSPRTSFLPRNARPGDGSDFYRICREPGARAPRRTVSDQPLGLARPLSCHHCHRCAGGRHHHALHAPNRGAPRAEAGA